MFMLVSTHKAALDALKSAHAAELAAYRMHLEDLQRLVFPPQNTTSIPLVQLEADAVLSVRETTVDLTEEELKRREDEISERNRILSGQY